MSKKNNKLELMNAIKSGSLKMRPKRYFTLMSTILIVASVLSGLAVAYLYTIIFLWLKISFVDGPARGARLNLAKAISDFPIWALVLAIILLLLSIYLVRNINHLYRYKTRYIIVIFLATSLTMGMIFHFSGLGFEKHFPNSFQEQRMQNRQKMK